MLVPGAEAAGVYVVGTGSAGVAQTFLFFGVVYFLVIMVSAFLYRVPVAGYKPRGWEPPSGRDSSERMISQKDVHMDQALKTPQFYQVWVVLCLNVTAGIGIISVAKTMMTEIFSSALPGIVDVTFAATYVLMIGMFNMLGRVMWASASDKLGRRNTCSIFCAAGFLLYLSIPVAAHYVNLDPSIFWLLMFYAATMIIFTFYGGCFRYRSGISCRSVRYPLRRRYLRAFADRLERCRSARPPWRSPRLETVRLWPKSIASPKRYRHRNSLRLSEPELTTSRYSCRIKP